MHNHREHLRRQAHRHHEAHLRLKQLLRHAPLKEKVWGVFVTTFLLALLSLVIYGNWGLIRGAFPRESTPPPPEVHGFKTGIVASFKINQQADRDYRNALAGVPTFGSMVGVTTAKLLAEPPKIPPLDVSESIQKSIGVTTLISSGQHLTPYLQKNARGVQKSVLATHYFGEQTVDLSSVLGRDTQLLSQIKNALSVDVFDYLNQSVSRADSLNSYLNLLQKLSEKTKERGEDLDHKINFLTGNLAAQETQITSGEQQFFENLKIFNAPNAEEELSKFIGLQTESSELRARLGAYQALRGYYTFFGPRLENLIKAIQLNRDALIAGVKVVEIENMTLPLIIREQR